MSACSSTDETSIKQGNPEYINALKSVHLTKFSPNYPTNKKRLIGCKKANDIRCQSLYDKSLRAKNVIINQGIDTLINAISTNCSKNYDETLCFGAFISIYWFTKYDEKLITAIQNIPTTQVNNLFNVHYEWFYNRNDPKQWSAVISDLNTLENNYHPWLEDRFSEKPDEPFGLMNL